MIKKLSNYARIEKDRAVVVTKICENIPKAILEDKPLLLPLSTIELYMTSYRDNDTVGYISRVKRQEPSYAFSLLKKLNPNFNMDVFHVKIWNLTIHSNIVRLELKHTRQEVQIKNNFRAKL